MRKCSFTKLLSCMLAFVLAFTPVLSAFPTVQAKAAQSTVWYHVEAGSGSGNGHNYSQPGNASVLVHQDKRMTIGDTFSFTVEKQTGEDGKGQNARLGFFYTYTDDSNWLYVGMNPNGSWYYEYKVGGSGGYPSLSLPDITDGTTAEMSIRMDREKLVVTVNGEKAEVNNQDFIALAEAVGNEGQFGFRAGYWENEAGNTMFRFKDAKVGSEDLGGTWEFLAENANQVFEEQVVPVHTVSGKVQNKDGAAIEGAKVRVGSEGATTDANGAFSVDVEEGTYTVSVSARGYQAYSKDGVEVTADLTLEPIVMAAKEAITSSASIQKDSVKAVIGEKFPQVYEYELTDGAETKKIAGQNQKHLNQVKVNGVAITPVEPTGKSVEINADNAVYPMALKDAAAKIDMEMTVKVSVAENDLTWEVTEIKKNVGCEKIHSIEVPDLNLVTVDDMQSGAQFMGANVSSDTQASGDSKVTFENGFAPNSSAGFAYGFLSADGVTAGVWSNSEKEKDRRLTRNNGADFMSLTSSEWYYEYNNEDNFIFYNPGTEGNAEDPRVEYDHIPLSELPQAKVCLAGDLNEDGVSDWQDGAIAYRDIMNNPYGWEAMKDLVNYRISMNFSSQATNPYLKVADSIKKVYLATDGLPQAVMMKGYGSEGHDSANSEYGNVGERIGGIDDLKELNKIAHQYNTEMGIHINAQEAYPEAQSFSDDLINGPNNRGWGWLDQSYTINRAYDLGSGLRYKRLLQLYDQLNGTSLYANKWPGVVGEGGDKEVVADADTIAKTVEENVDNPTNFDFMYLDVWYGDSWETRKIAHQFNSLGWRFSTEFGYEGEYDSTWHHWSTEGHYGGSGAKGLNSDVIRFIRNHQKDNFVLNWPKYGGTADNPLLGGFDLTGFEGWGSHNDSFDTYITKTFLANVPTKFLQHYMVYKWENYEGEEESPVGNHEKQITLKSEDGKDTVVVARNEDQITPVDPEGKPASLSADAHQTYNYVERTIKLNDKVVLDNAKYLLPWIDSETKEEKLYFYDYHGGESTWDLQDDWASLANVKVYKITDIGRTEEKTVNVENGKLKLNAERNTPYVVVKGTSTSPKKEIEEWSTASHVKDSGFNAYAGTGDGDALDSDIWSGTADEMKNAKVVRIGEANNATGTGNKYLRMDGAAKVSTEISGLEKGKDYVAQIYVDNESDAKAWIKVTQGSDEVSNYTLKSIAQNYVQCDAHSTRAVAGSNMQRMLVPFVAKAATATLTLEREAGEGITYFDDIRIVEKEIDNIQADGSFKQDFESVVSGLYPFVMGPAQGVNDHVTHLSELHAPYTQAGWGNETLDDVLDGKWSLKHHGSNNGIIYRTIPQNLHMEPGQAYKVSFDYEAGVDSNYYMVIGEGEQALQSLDLLEVTPLSEGKVEKKSYSFVMSGAQSGQSWFGLASLGGGSTATGTSDFVLDNLVVTPIDVKINVTGDTQVTSSANAIDMEVVFTGEASDVTWSSSDETVAIAVPDKTDGKKAKVHFVGFGDAVISAVTTVGGEEIILTTVVSLLESEELPDDEKQVAEWTNVYANTQSEADGDVAANAIDGNTATHWHSEWSPNNFAVSEDNPAKLTVEAKDDIEGMNRLMFTQRSSNTNGIVVKYKVVVGTEFDPATHEVSGDVVETEVRNTKNPANGQTESCILPEGAKGKYVQIQVLNGMGGFASIAEVALDKVKNNNTPDENQNLIDNIKEAAKADVEEATGVIDENKTGNDGKEYTVDAWKELNEKKDAFENADDKVTASQLAQMRQEMVAATNKFKELKESGALGAQQTLSDTLAGVSEIKDKGNEGNANYTAESWSAFLSAYNKAEKGKNSDDKEALETLNTKLADAAGKLVTVLADAQEKLTAAVAAATEVKAAGQKDYSNESWNAFLAALDAAEKGKDLTDTAAIKTLTDALADAQKNLTEVKGLEAAKQAVTTVITAATALKNAGKGDYTDASWNAFLAALDAAEKGKNSSDPAELARLQKALEDAQKALVKAPVLTKFTVGGRSYSIVNAAKKTVKLTKGKNAKTEKIGTVSYNGVKYTVVTIGKNAYKNANKLVNLTIGAGVTKIEKMAFNNCKKLAKVTFSAKKKLPSMNGGFVKTKNKPTIKVQKVFRKNAKAKKNTLGKMKKAGFKKITTSNIK